MEEQCMGAASGIARSVHIMRAALIRMAKGRCWIRALTSFSRLLVICLCCAGIGKSMFRCYLLYRLCQKHVQIAAPSAFAVVLQTPPDVLGGTAGFCELLRFRHAAASAAPLVVCERSPSHKLPSAWKELLREPPANESIYYVADGLSPDVLDLDVTKVHVLEVSSPQEARWKPFKTGLAAGVVEERFMPLVALREMQHMRVHVGSLTPAEVMARYQKLGGSVRGVLVRWRESADAIVKQALSHAKSLDAVLSSSTMSGELEGSGLAHVPSTLIHFRVSEEEQVSSSLVTIDGVEVAPLPSISPPFCAYEPVFASNFVRKEIVLKFNSKFVSLLGEMVRTPNMPFTSVLRGNLFEEFVHQRVQAAQTNACPVRRLDCGAAAAAAAQPDIDLSSLPCVEFDDLSELTALQLQDGHYYKPISKSFGAVDFVLGTHEVGNMTLNLHHGLSLTALLRVVRAMGFQPVQDGGEVPILRFLWLLPTRALFSRMHAQPLSYCGRVVSASAGDATGRLLVAELASFVQLQQFAVLMEPISQAEGKDEEDSAEEAEASHTEQADTQEAMVDEGQAAAAAAAAGANTAASSSTSSTAATRKRSRRKK